MKKEIWKAIKNFSDYEVSNFGKIKSFKNYRQWKPGRILTPGKNKFGYLYVNLYKNKKPHPKSIHRLVLEAFKPNKDLNKTQCNHKDGNKENNYVENLEWCTDSENKKHAFKIGLRIPMKGENHPNYRKNPSEETKKKISEKLKGKNNPFYGKHHSEETRRKQSEKKKGENHPRSTLTEKNVIEIWKDLNEGVLTQKQIGEKFGITQATISLIKNKKIWKHIGELL